MVFHPKYSGLGQVLIAAVFLLVNAGFTSVLHSCLMDDKVCCAAITAGDAPGGDHSTPPVSTAFKLARSTCCENAIVGGLSGISALSESKGKTETQKSTMLHLVAGPFTPILKPAIPSSYYFTARYPSSPPSREIYVLTSALLI